MRLAPETDSLPRLLAFPLLASAAVLAAAFAVRGGLLERAASCPLRALTGVACPTCGGTHAALALVRLDLAGAWRQNPLVAAAAVGLLAWAALAAAATLVRRWRVKVELTRGEQHCLRIGVILAVLANWAYEIARAR